jgi:hypothetical protein
MPPLSFKDRCIILAQNAASLSFKSPKAEDEFLLSVARQRLPVLAALASFDVLIYATRIVIKFMLQDESSPMAVGRKMFQLSALYVVLLSIYWFSCSSGRAARQVRSFPSKRLPIRILFNGLPFVIALLRRML